jgi:hypothetical protein
MRTAGEGHEEAGELSHQGNGHMVLCSRQGGELAKTRGRQRVGPGSGQMGTVIRALCLGFVRTHWSNLHVALWDGPFLWDEPLFCR